MAVATASVRRGAVVLVRLPRDKARHAVVVRSDVRFELSYTFNRSLQSWRHLTARHEPFPAASGLAA